MAKQPDNIWKKSADPKQRAAATKRYEKSHQESRRPNVQQQSFLDKMTGKSGREQKRR